MSKQNINVGTSANDKKGDSLRAAFIKVNANFTELYEALGLTDVTLNLGAFTFTGSTMSTDDSTNIVIDKPITVNGEIIADGDIVPTLDNTYSLGSESLRWKEVHIGPGTLFIQDQNDAGLNAELTVVDGVLNINGANQLQVGQLKFVDNTIESETGSEDIQIGLLTSSASLVLNRNVVMGADKTFQLRDGNDNIILQLTTDESGQGKIVYGGGSTGITMGDGLVINGIGHQDYTSGSQVLSYATSTGKVTYGQIKYEGILGFPRMPNYWNDTAANTAVGTPLKGHMYYNTTDDKVYVYTGSSWQAMN